LIYNLCARLRNRRKMSYCIYPAIKFAINNVIQFNNKNKENGNPIDTSIVVSVRGVV
jgi:hypothetical protein